MPKLPFVILHGWNLSGEKYLPLIRMLGKKGTKVYYPDLPGFGKSGIPNKPFVLSDYVEYVNRYLIKNKLNKIILLGHSFGGRVAIKLTATYPDKISALILTGVPGFLPVSSAKIIFFLILSKLGKKLFRLPGLNFFEVYARRILYKAAHASDYQRAKGVMRETFKLIIKEDLKIPMEKIDCPTLLVWGALDKTVPPNIAYEMQKIIRKSSLEILDNATHRLPYEASEKMMQTIESFLNRYKLK